MIREPLARIGFAARQLRADAGPATLLLVLVAVLAALVSGGPSLIRSFADQEVRQAATDLSLLDRSLSEQTTIPLPYVGGPAALPADQRWWGPLEQRLAEIRADFPAPVRDLVGEARFLSRTGRVAVDKYAGQQFDQLLQFDSDPFVTEHLRLAQGRWPRVLPAVPDQLPPLEMVLGAPAALRLQWTVGTSRSVAGRTVTLVGVAAEQPVDPEFLSIEPNALTALVIDDGNAPIRLVAVAFLADGAWDAGVLFDDNGGITGRLWYPTQVEKLDTTGVPELVSQLRRVTGLRVELGAPGADSANSLQLSTELSGALVAALARADAAGSVQWVAMSGPFGAAIAVLVLGLQAFARRRMEVTTLLVDRGAAPSTVRTIALAQGLLIGVPGAVVGVLAVRTFASWPVPWWAVLIGLLVMLVAPVYLAAVAAPGRSRRARADLTTTGSRSRWVAEAIVIVLAALSVTLLLTGALDPAEASDAASGGSDLLVLLAPILSILAVCVLTLRLYPVPLLLIRSVTRRRRGLVAHLGVTRSLREPAVGLPLILACLTGVTVATFSVTMLSTIDRGIADAAARAAGSDLTMTGAPTFPSVIELAGTAPGVRSVATLGDAGPVEIDVGARTSRAELFFGDTAALSRVLADVPRAAVIPGGMAADVGAGAPVPVVTSSGLGASAGGGITVKGEPAAVVGAGDFLPQASGEWILVDSAHVAALVAGRATGSVLLMSLQPGADPQPTSDFLNRKIPTLEGVLPTNFDGTTSGNLLFSSPSASERQLSQVPTVEGMRVVLTVITILSAILTVLAVLVLAVGGTRQRSRLLAMLRLLGLRPRQAAALSAWEQGPPVITAVVVGGGFGLVLAVLVQRAVDLRAFTGDVLAPNFFLDGDRLLVMAGGFAVAVVMAVGLSAVLSGRAAAGSILRGEP